MAASARLELLMAWKADQLQAVVFAPANIQQIGALEIWKKITDGQEPDAFQRAGISPVGVSQASGTVENSTVGVVNQPGRTDISIEPIPTPQSPSPPPQIAEFEPAIELLLRLSGRLAIGTTLNRVAIVCHFANHCHSPDEAARIVADSSGASFPIGSTDLIYQHNVRREFPSATHHEMNRIHTWSVGLKQLLTFTTGLQGGAFPQQGAVTYHIAALKMDFNSATQTDISGYSAAMLRDIGTELLEAANRYCSEA